MGKILAYHSIGNSVAEVGASLYCVNEARFREQLSYLLNTQYSIPNTKPVITFDDGDITNYTKAYPILKEFGMKASFFIIGERVGAKEYMNWRQIKELKDSGMTIGSHGMTHRILTGLNDRELDYELRQSKRILEENLWCTIDTLSIPRGFCNAKIMSKAKDVHYKTIFTSDNRIVVMADWDIDRFTHAINGKHTVSEKLVKLLKNSSKRLLGDRSYDLLRTRILNLRPMS
jgi:peptidoglycan/xylan/chitin deacetylase (PgdA/CDA1 family)